MRHIKSYLARDHRQCDELVAAACAAADGGVWDEAQAAASVFHGALLRHQSKEEQVLFPRFEGADRALEAVTGRLRIEHARIGALARELFVAVRDRDIQRVEFVVPELIELMEQHNAGEEAMLFSMIEEMLGAQADRLIDQMEEAAASCRVDTA